jgi:hypothetical protein
MRGNKKDYRNSFAFETDPQTGVELIVLIDLGPHADRHSCGMSKGRMLDKQVVSDAGDFNDS